MELGLLLFMVGVGLNAGGGIVEALGAVGPVLFLCGVVVTCMPLLAGYGFGRAVLKMNPALLVDWNQCTLSRSSETVENSPGTKFRSMVGRTIIVFLSSSRRS